MADLFHAGGGYVEVDQRGIVDTAVDVAPDEARIDASGFVFVERLFPRIVVFDALGNEHRYRGHFWRMSCTTTSGLIATTTAEKPTTPTATSAKV